ncbi:MAG: histidine kinase N-terminal 7TM domain-containing protein [Anaerolineaceae bacterium]
MDQYTLFVLLSPFAIFLSLFISVYCWQRRNVRAARSLAIVMGAVTCYVIFNTLELVDPTPRGTEFFGCLGYPFIGILSIGWFYFALEYTDHIKFLPKRQSWLLWVIPTLATLLVFTNSMHHLIWRSISFDLVSHGFLHLKVNSYGPFFWVFWIQAYILILSGATLILWANFSPNRQYQKQTRITLAGAVLPILVNAVYVLRLIPGLDKDFSPIGYAFSGIFLAVGIFKFRLFDLAPLARATLIDQMSDGMLTLDADRDVVDFNRAARRILSNEYSLKVGEVCPLFTTFLDQVDAAPENTVLDSEISLRCQGKTEIYDVSIRPLRGTAKSTLGYLISFHNITELKNLLQITRQLAGQDPLTGILNRRYINTLAGEAFNLADQNHSRCCVVMMDIDFFKEINDTKGHSAGDQVLQAFVHSLRRMLRSTDLLARIGGDEFVLLLPETTLQTARSLTERLCKAIASEPLVTADYGSVNITISMGIAERVGDEPPSLDELINRADQNLYQAKKMGRNCVWYTEPEPI